MKRRTLALFILSTVTSGALGQNLIVQLNNFYEAGTDYIIEQDVQKITIFSAIPSEEYQIEARDPSDPDGLGDIDIITLSGTPNTIRLHVRGVTQDHGARHIRRIDLPTSQTNETSLQWIRIAGDLGADGMSEVDNLGLIDVDGDILAGLIADDLASLFVAGDLIGGMTLNTLSGAITIDGDVPSTISIAGNVARNIEIRGVFSGAISIGGDVIDGQNHIWIRHMIGGSISCRDMNLRSLNGGEWLTLGAFAPFDPTLVQSGTIDVNGTLTGRIYCRTISDLDITIGTLNALNDNNGGLAGIMSGVGWLPTSSITVTGDFVRGAIH